MTSTLPDFSGKPELRPLAGLVQALREAGGIGEADCLPIGAAVKECWPYAACLIKDSAGMPSPLCSFQAMAMVSGRLWLSTSYTRLGWPM